MCGVAVCASYPNVENVGKRRPRKWLKLFDIFYNKWLKLLVFLF